MAKNPKNDKPESTPATAAAPVQEASVSAAPAVVSKVETVAAASPAAPDKAQVYQLQRNLKGHLSGETFTAQQAKAAGLELADLVPFKA